ncbi:MAG: antitoxin [Hyphomicrobiales bacterium]|nr:antitoxin [Hyphomicrobiales bacterium]MDE2016759.1 antitoxin [Hyphomicrobiales bacterium]
MVTTCLRKVGGSVMLAVPPALLDVLHLAAGAEIGLTIDDGRLVVVPMVRSRVTLAELLDEAESAQAYPLRRNEREWVDASAAGREIET